MGRNTTARHVVNVGFAAACLLLSACAPNSEARLQAQYARTVSSDVITKFVVRDPNDPSRYVGAYAVVKAQMADPEAIWCRYQPNARGQTITSYVKLFKIESHVEERQVHYHPVPQSTALDIMQQAPDQGDELSKIGEILGARNAGYDAFPTDEQGSRHFLFTDCRKSA